MWVFPSGDIDDPKQLLSVLGSFWASTYEGSYPVEGFAYARGRLAYQGYIETLALLAACSRFTVPVFDTDDWFLYTFRESQLNRTEFNLPSFGDGNSFGPGQGSFGVPASTSQFTFPAPANLVRLPVLMNRITEASLTLSLGIDFFARPGSVTFRINPFDNDLVPVREIIEGNEVVDREAGLWVYQGQFDLETVYRQFGYALGLHLKSSEGYRELINAAFDGLVDGGTARSNDRVLAAAAGVTLAHGYETVVDVVRDARHLWVITDKFAYAHHLDALPRVAVGDSITPGDSLTDTMTVHEFNRGAVPPNVRALSMGRGFVPAGFFRDIVFESKDVPLIVEENVRGYTRVSFEIGGWPGDVEAFWNDCHTQGIASGLTLAMLLDTRPVTARDSQPTAAALPTTVNPLKFLITNVLRNNAYLVVLKPHLFLRNALGLAVLPALLRKVVPPHTCCIVLVQLAGREEPAILGSTPETVRSFSGATIRETVTLSGEDSGRARQLSGHCE